jgi:C1A family cysteine protease
MDHISTHGISYGTKEEYQFRLQVFAENDAEIERINSNPNNLFECGHNRFSTLTNWEFKKRLGKKPSTRKPTQDDLEFTYLPTEGLPDSVDWRG